LVCGGEAGILGVEDIEKDVGAFPRGEVGRVEVERLP
jgi:hypothetical protein